MILYDLKNKKKKKKFHHIYLLTLSYPNYASVRMRKRGRKGRVGLVDVSQGHAQAHDDGQKFMYS